MNKDLSEGLDHKAKGFAWFGGVFFKATPMLVITGFPEATVLTFKAAAI